MSESKKRVMLVDAAQPDETRIAIVENHRIQELDYEITQKKNLKGNIYLAKIVRVEPSLQAAFIDFGGNTHGFLPFSEIHPSYFRIPVADREKIEAELEQLSAQTVSTDEAEEEFDTEGSPLTPSNIRERYKIQEVIENRQVMLVQVVKEARGNKGAALTTYLSLPGRYCVLMPNNLRGTGGVSRKIYDQKDRKRLKEIHDSLGIEKGMGLILRTAGTKKTKLEIKRDYQFLLKNWEEIRTLTLESNAPALIYEEANLLKRYVRDVYDKDIEEILVEGKEGYKLAKQFVKKLMPAHAKRVQEYKDPAISLFSKYKVETQIDNMFDTHVSLPSGGYLVIDTTEALVAIDINSGKATKERNIRETALKTNLEAADEIARQLKLRDLGGLIVVDFIDMEDAKHNAEVEKRLRNKMSTDRARVQIGRISNFGLLELSRQRLRPSLVDNHFKKCSHCHGTGLVRVKASSARMILRMLGELSIDQKVDEVLISCHPDVAIYLLNEKRDFILQQEQRNQVRILVEPEIECTVGQYMIDLFSEGQKISNGSIKVKEVKEEDGERGKNKKSQKRNKNKKNKENSAPKEPQTQEKKEVEKIEPVSENEKNPEKSDKRKNRKRPQKKKPHRNEGDKPVINEEGKSASIEVREMKSEAIKDSPAPKEVSKVDMQKGSKPMQKSKPEPKVKPKTDSASQEKSQAKPATPANIEEKTEKKEAKPKKKGWWGKLIN